MSAALIRIKPSFARISRGTGFILLPVMLAMTLLAASAFLLNRYNSMNTNIVSKQMDRDRAYYIAEAGIQAVNATIQSPAKSCAGGFPTVASPVNFAGGTYEAYASAANGTKVDITSKGSYNGTVVTLTRKNALVYQSDASSYNVQPDDLEGVDTYLSNTGGPFGNSNSMQSNWGKNPLMKFDLSKFPTGTVATTANLAITSTYLILVNDDVYRVNNFWTEADATWTKRNATENWNRTAGDYHSAKLGALIPIVSGWATVDLPDIAAAWLSDRYFNQGLLVSPRTSFFTKSYVSSNSTDISNHPKFRLDYYLPCGNQADTFIDKSAENNNGSATSLSLEKGAGNLEKRILIQFDTSRIPAGSTISSATLKLYVSGLTNASSSAKDIRANAMHQAWVDGAGTDTTKTCGSVESLIGSAGASWAYSDKCKKWSPVLPPTVKASSNWLGMAGMPTERYGLAVVTLGNKIYAMGGTRDGSNYLDTVEEYDPSSNTWRARARMKTARGYFAAVVFNNKIYAIGGTDGNNALRKTEIYDPVNNVWTDGPNLNAKRSGLGAEVVNNKIYAIGGVDNRSPSPLAGGVYPSAYEIYDPSVNTWNPLSGSPLGIERSLMATAVYNNKIYAIGGMKDGVVIKTIQEFNTTNDQWARKADITSPLASMAHAVVGKKIYFIGGSQPGLTANVVTYDLPTIEASIQGATIPSTNETALPAAWASADAVNLDNLIFTVGGRNSASSVANTSRLDAFEAIAKDSSLGSSPPASSFRTGFIEFDVKPLLQSWIDGVRFNNGIVVYSNVADKISINSFENSSNKPQLIVQY